MFRSASAELAKSPSDDDAIEAFGNSLELLGDFRITDTAERLATKRRAIAVWRDALARNPQSRRWKPIAIGEATRIFGACDVPPKAMIVLALTGHEELAADWMHREIGDFLEAFLLALPGALHEALGGEIGELRPRWAGGSAKLLARNLAQHVADLGRRGDAIGEQYSALSANHGIRA